MRLRSLLAFTFLCLLVMPLAAQAQVDYNEGFEILPSNYLAPRMDCVGSGDGRGQKCVLLAFDNTTKKLELFTTVSRFMNDSLPLTPNQTVVTDANFEHIIAINPSTSTPYDISAWDTNDFGIIYQDNRIQKFVFSSGTITTLQTLTSGHVTYFYPINFYSYWLDVDPFACRDSGFYRDFDGLNPVGIAAYDYENTSACTSINSDYLAGQMVDIRIVQPTVNDRDGYILFAYNSTTGAVGYSNNTDAQIGAGVYDGIYERTWFGLSSYNWWLHNNTHVLRYDEAGNATQPFFKFNGNTIIAQSLWVNPTDANDMIITFQNSSGINLYTTWASLYNVTPDEYNESKVTIAVKEYNPYLFGYVNAPYFPKIACSPSLGSCAMLFYDAGWLSTGGVGLKLYYTLTPDQDDWNDYIYKFPESYTITPDEAPPYDICYHVSSGKFRIISGSANRLYEWDGVTTPVNVYTYTGGGSWNNRYPLMFADDNCEYLFAGDDLSATFWNHIVIYPWASTTSVANFEYGGNTLTYVRGYATALDDYSEAWYDIYASSGTHENLDLSDDAQYAGLIQYYYPEEGVAFFERDGSDTPANLGEGIYYAGHVYPHGLVWSYPTVTPYYTYDVTVGEQTETMSTYFEESKIYAVARRATNMGCIPFFGCGKLYYYQKANNPVFVTTSYIDTGTGFTNPLNTSMTLECLDPSINYTSVATGIFNVFQLPCNSNINLTLQTASAYPFYHESNFDFFSGCNQISVEATYIQSFDSTITVREAVGSYDPIAGATVYIDGVPYITDASGQVTKTLAPTSATFAVTNYAYPTCLISLDATGATVSESRYLYITKSGYYPESGTYNLTAAGVPIYLDKGEYIVSKVFYSSGAEATGSEPALIKASGGNSIYILESGIPTIDPDNSSSSFPVTFQTIGSHPYNIVLNLTWGNHTETKTVAVSTAKSSYGCGDNACFYLPFDLDEGDVGCTNDLHCEASVCIGNLYRELIGCNIVTGECGYQDEMCPVHCDVDTGCYTDVTNNSCPSGLDSECYGLIQCVNTGILQNAECSDTLGVCVTYNIQCDYGCENNACQPAPEAVFCDQSTVAGMLDCFLSGLMGFIGLTYDPMFMIILVVAIVIIFATLLSLAVKGVSNVIR